jgi:protein TonB
MKTPFTFVLMALCAVFSSVTARSQSTYPGAKADSAFVDSLSRVFTNVEIESEFPGGARAWLQYLNEHLVYPKKAVRKRIEGTVLLQFIVDKDGNISDLSVLSGDPILAEAALKAMVDCPRWHPAIKNGRKVKSYKKQPIVFKLQAQ